MSKSFDGYEYDGISEEIWNDNYKGPDELVREDTWKRAAKKAASIEKPEIRDQIESDFEDILHNDRFVPGGRILANLGIDSRKATTLFNCFVHNPHDIKLKDCDSLEGIYDMLKAQAMTLRSEGGYGVNASWIRPSGTYVKGIGSRTPGPLKFMELWDKSSEIITMGSVKIKGPRNKNEKSKIRKGAQMLVLNVWHPDIKDFIVAKQTPGVLTKFNMSVGITEGFIKAVKNNEKWDLKFPDTTHPEYKNEWFGFIEDWEEKGLPVIVHETVNAVDIWDLILKATYERAEPGVLFLDIANKLNPISYADKIATTNPCFTKDQRLLTTKGYETFESLLNNQNNLKILTDNRIEFNGTSEKESWIITPDNFGSTVREAYNVRLTQKNADVYEVNYTNGMVQKLTADHHIATTVGMVEAKDLNESHDILVNKTETINNIRNKEPETDEEIEALLMGLVAGDGTFSKNIKIHLDFWGEDRFRIVELIKKYVDVLYNKHYKIVTDSVALKHSWKSRKLSNYYVSNMENENKTRISSTWLSHYLEIKYGFNRTTKLKVHETLISNCRETPALFYVAGLYYADASFQGSRVSGYSARLHQSDEDMLRQVQLILSANGVSASIHKRRDFRICEIKGKTYRTKPQYELITSNRSYIEYASIGFFGHPEKEEKLDQAISLHIANRKFNYVTNLKSFNYIGKEDVYCLSEDVTRSCVVNGISARRCGEVPMSTGVCNIGSINLVTLVKETENGLEFDYDEFETTIKSAIRFLDNINEISTTPLPEYDKSVKDKHRIGLGVMGLGSLHIMLGIPYGSPESLVLQERIAKIKAETELLASAKLGKEKGSFDLFDAGKYFDSYYFNSIAIDQKIKDEVVSIGAMRNSHQSMNAPTGNTGIYARNVSGGIEPVFSTDGYYRWCIVPEFKRRSLMDIGFKFPDTNKSEWFETEHVKFSMRGNEQILKGSFEGKNYEVDKSRGLTEEYLIEDYGVRFAKKYYGEKFEEMKKSGKFASVADLTTKNHTDSLKIWAHYTNMAISKTVNLPNDYSFEDFKSVYMDAWDNNIKGITTYREGTMTAVLETKENKANMNKKEAVSIVHHDAPKRPKILDCEIHSVKIKGESWTIFVGLLNGEPYEIFGGSSKFIQIPKAYKTGKMEKQGKKSDSCSQYDLTYGDEGKETIIKDIVSVFENPLYNYHTRSLSMKLRHGIPLIHITDMLQKDELGSELYSFNKVIARVLKTYIKDGTKKKGTCANCGSDDLVYQEGCFVCRSCSYSKCS